MPSSAQSIAELLGMIVIFLLVVAACYATTRFVAGKQFLQKKAGNFEVIETHSIAQNRYLQLVRMGNKYVVISVSKDAVRYITELSEDEVCFVKKDGQKEQKNFKELFSSLQNRKREESDQ